jgi:hypothetical protein
MFQRKLNGRQVIDGKQRGELDGQHFANSDTRLHFDLLVARCLAKKETTGQ